MKFGSIEAFVTFLRTRPAAVEAAEHRGLEAAGAMFVDTAKAMIGMEMPDWRDLAESTVEQKQRPGFVNNVSATDPLLRTGELRASISSRVEGRTVTLGSDDPIAPYQEYGTARIPPRPFINPTVFHNGHEAADLIANHTLGAAMGLAGPLHPVQHRDGDSG